MITRKNMLAALSTGDEKKATGKEAIKTQAARPAVPRCVDLDI